MGMQWYLLAFIDDFGLYVYNEIIKDRREYLQGKS